MKVLVYILSVYILALAAVPCIDRPVNTGSGQVEQTQNSTDHHSSDADHCSPFCTCQCCASLIDVQNILIHFNCFLLPQKHYSVYTSDYTLIPSGSIWQPPKKSGYNS